MSYYLKEFGDETSNTSSEIQAPVKEWEQRLAKGVLLWKDCESQSQR